MRPTARRRTKMSSPVTHGMPTISCVSEIVSTRRVPSMLVSTGLERELLELVEAYRSIKSSGCARSQLERPRCSGRSLFVLDRARRRLKPSSPTSRGSSGKAQRGPARRRRTRHATLARPIVAFVRSGFPASRGGSKTHHPSQVGQHRP